nr:alkaline phosphatase [Sandaracinobacteroides hominis]
MNSRFLAGIALAVTLASPALAVEKAKNIIILIADGSGYNTLQATRLWTGAPLFTDSNGFQTTSMSTYPLRFANTPIPGAAGLAQDPNTVYSSASNWDTTPVAGTTGAYPRAFEGYDWNRTTYPDSANTIVSLVTGEKTYNNAVNVNGNGDPLLTLAEVMVQNGREAGVVSTVQFGDATPSVGGGAHNISRGNRQAIANEMFGSGVLSVIGGTGNPDYDDNGNLRAANYAWITPELWNDLKTGTNVSGFNGQGWTLVQNRADIQAIANASVSAPEKLAMIAKADNGLQAYRGGLTANNDDPFATAQLDTSPTYTEMLLAGLERLNDNGNGGLYLLGEQGEPDRAMHANNLGRTIESYIDFQLGVEAVVNWIDSPDSYADWSNTLLIVTADHDHLLFGPDGATDPFQDLLPDDGDVGTNPQHRWFFGSHSNQLVPLMVRGVGANGIIGLADDWDSYTDEQGRTFGRGWYTDQAEVGRYLLQAAVPEPATWGMMIAGFGLVGLVARRRRTVTITA